MRRSAFCTWLALVGLSAGCSSSMSIEEARDAAVVSVDGVTLDGATLEQILLVAPGNVTPTQATSNLIVSAFVDAALLRKAINGQIDLTDSATIARIIEPDAIRGVVGGYMIGLAADYPEPSEAAIDSVTRLGQVRAFQAIAIRLPQAPDSSGLAQFRARVLSVYEDASAPGANFPNLVRRFGEDSQLTALGGQLPAMQRSALPQGANYDATWELEPGKVGRPIVVPPYAMILRRDSLPEARPTIKSWLVPVRAVAFGREWLDSVRTAKQLSVAPDAVERLRELAKEPFTGGGDAALMTWQGGELTPDQVRLWISVLPPDRRAVLPGLADSALTILMSEVADRYIVRGVAQNGESLPSGAFEELAPQFRAAYSSLDSAYRAILVAPDSSQAVREFIRGVTSGKLAYRPLPGAMVWVLREDAKITVDQQAIDAILTAVRPRWQARHDSVEGQARDSLARTGAERSSVDSATP